MNALLQEADPVSGHAQSERDAVRFLNALGHSHTFQTFDDTRERRRGLPSILHGSLGQHLTRLGDLNADGAGIFVMVNQGDSLGRKTENVVGVRAVFVDLDGAPIEPVTECALAPHIIVESSPNRWHAYWLVEGVPLNQFKQIQKAIAKRFGGDPSVNDLPRVMRVPGFLHRKGLPFATRIHKLVHLPKYGLEAILTEFGSDEYEQNSPPTTLPKVIQEGARNQTLFGAARGFVRRGITLPGVTSRVRKLNNERCRPPLPDSEVEDLCTNASAIGADGFLAVPRTLLTSPEWETLPSDAKVVLLRFCRIHNGFNNGKLALPASEFCATDEMSERRYYKARQVLIDRGLLVLIKPMRNSQSGKLPAEFALVERCLWKPNRQNDGSGQYSNRQSYIDLQL